MGAVVAEGDQSEGEAGRAIGISPQPHGVTPGPVPTSPPPVSVAAASPPVTSDPAAPAGGSSPLPFALQHLLLLDTAEPDPVSIDEVNFTDDGIGVVRTHGEQSRVLPWSSVMAHAVEPWGGGLIPEWWVDPALDRRGTPTGAVDSVTDPDATSRARPHAGSGALIGIQTPAGTYRFLLPGGDARELSRRITIFAVSRQGPAAASSVSRLVTWGQDMERRKVKRRPKRTVSWSTVQPFLVVALILFLGTAVALILLQSAGTIHLPYLGGTGPGATVGLPSDDGWGLRIR
jgi:hypothetical protein